MLGDRLREPIHHRVRHRGIRLTLRAGAFPDARSHRNGVVVQPLDGGHIREVPFDALLDRDAAQADMRKLRHHGWRLSSAPRLERADCVEKGFDFVARDATIDGDAVHAALLEPLDQRSDGVCLRHRLVVDDHFLADESDDHGRLEAVEQLNRG